MDVKIYNLISSIQPKAGPNVYYMKCAVKILNTIMLMLLQVKYGFGRSYAAAIEFCYLICFLQQTEIKKIGQFISSLDPVLYERRAETQRKIFVGQIGIKIREHQLCVIISLPQQNKQKGRCSLMINSIQHFEKFGIINLENVVESFLKI